MVSLVEVYERQAVDCVQAAARIDDPEAFPISIESERFPTAVA